MWVTDEAGNQEFCDVSVNVQDNTGNVCPDNNLSLVNISGRAQYLDGKAVQNADVQITEDGKLLRSIATNSNGNFSISDITSSGLAQLRISKEEAVDKGINTLDLIYIQKHILGLDRLTKPSQLISADFNSDGRISVADIVAIRQVVLGTNVSIEGGPSLKFVETKTLAGTNMSNLTFKESVTLHPTITNQANLDFTAIKMGDIDESASLGLQGRTRDMKSLSYEINGNKASIFVTNEDQTNGFQLSLKVKNGKILGITSKQLEILAENYHVNAQGDEVKISWNADRNSKLLSSIPIFEISLDNFERGELALSSPDFNQWYTLDNHSLPVFLKNKDDVRQLIVKNSPNPFNDYTDIGIFIADKVDQNIKVSVFDALGKTIMNKEANVANGDNTFRIHRSDLNGVGIYYCTIQIGDRSKTLKLVLTN
jgi:hypothetical protein